MVLDVIIKGGKKSTENIQRNLKYKDKMEKKVHKPSREAIMGGSKIVV